MGYYFRGTAEDMLSSIHCDLRKATEPGPSDDYFNRALASIVGLWDRQAEMGPLDPPFVKAALGEIYEKLLQFSDKIKVYTKRAAILAEDRSDRWYEVCIRRSVVQVLLDTWPGTPLAQLIDPSDVAELDAEMRRAGLEEGPIPEETAPKGLPDSHWWWKYPNSAGASSEAPSQRSDPLQRLQDKKGRAEDLDFREANLRGVSLRDARLLSCKFEKADLENADFSGATLRLCALDDANGTSSRFDGARLEDSSAEGAEFSRASLQHAHLTETSFSRADLRGAVFDSAEGDGVEFRGADLRGARLIGARFDEADFRGADLRGADLAQGRFHSADFRGALLDGASFTGADCDNAWFDEGEGPHASARSKTASAGAPFDQAGFAALCELLASLPEAVASHAHLPPELLDRLRRARDVLGASEPPEEWKAWLEPLMKISQGQPSLDQVLAALQSAAGKWNPEELQTWLEGVMRNSSCHEETHDPKP